MKTIQLAMAMMLLTGAAAAQDPLKALPKNYWVEFENAQVRVVHVHYGAGEHVPIHDHPKTPTLYVYLSDAGPVKFVHTGDDNFSIVRKPVKTGQLRLSPGRVETHEVVSMSRTASDFLRVEFKTLPLQLASLHARMPAAGEDFWKEPNQIVFEDSHLSIRRVGVGPNEMRFFGTPNAPHTLKILVKSTGTKINGTDAHAGQAFDADVLRIQTGKYRAELLYIELK